MQFSNSETLAQETRRKIRQYQESVKDNILFVYCSTSIDGENVRSIINSILTNYINQKLNFQVLIYSKSDSSNFKGIDTCENDSGLWNPIDINGIYSRHRVYHFNSDIEVFRKTIPFVPKQFINPLRTDSDFIIIEYHQKDYYDYQEQTYGIDEHMRKMSLIKRVE